MSKTRKIILLGATGSIGSSTLRLLRRKRDHFKLIGISANKNFSKLLKIAEEFDVSYIAINDKNIAKKYKFSSKIFVGPEGLIELASVSCDIVVSGISGIAGLFPAITAIRSGNNLAIANKEPLVVAGKIFVEEAKKYNVKILPVDSEHSSIFQCFNESHRENISHITLTASGGPFLNLNKREFKKIKPNDAIRHPNWKMGKKISVDSSTLINKALEIIEAGVLFDLKSHQVDVIIHPESIVHGLVHYKDGSVIANLSLPDMISPLAVALGHPNRVNLNSRLLDLKKISKLTFDKPDLKKFPGLSFGWKSLDAGGAYPIILNAANEIAVEYFLKNIVSYNNIIDIIKFSLSNVNVQIPNNIEDSIEIDKITRLEVLNYIKGL